MQIITTTDALAALCREARTAPYVTLDTEFLRERTYWAKLCLIQMALPGANGAAALIDPIAGETLSLDPLYELFRHPDTVKVFHAARQDLEIFFTEGNVIPAPLFDTQVAAMVCGFGEQAGYETLVRKIARTPLDKTSRFTDWSRRPLSQAQMDYALADVTHLRTIYEHLSAEIEGAGRSHWVAEEMAVLSDPATYTADPETAWQRIRTRNSSGRFLALVRELARFRETCARNRNIPRTRVMKDDALLEIASLRPQSPEDLGKARLLLREGRRADIAAGILEAVRTALDLPPEALPKVAPAREGGQGCGALSDLLRVLLKSSAEAAGVAPKLIAQTAELDTLAAGGRDLPLLHGWRHEVFGHDALRLCAGKIALSAGGGAVRVIEVPAKS